MVQHSLAKQQQKTSHAPVLLRGKRKREAVSAVTTSLSVLCGLTKQGVFQNQIQTYTTISTHKHKRPTSAIQSKSAAGVSAVIALAGIRAATSLTSTTPLPYQGNRHFCELGFTHECINITLTKCLQVASSNTKVGPSQIQGMHSSRFRAVRKLRNVRWDHLQVVAG